MIVDDHPLMREGMSLRISTQRDLTVCGDAASENEALLLVEKANPDLVIVDLTLAQGHGLDLIKQIKYRYPRVKMLVVSAFQESLYAERALRAGAQGYLNKHESSERVLEAIRTLLAGKRFVSAEIAQRLMDKAIGGNEEIGATVERLTDRELEIFRLIGEGMTTSAIANKLFLSTHTIDSHRENIKRKLALKNAGELTRAAVQWLLES